MALSDITTGVQSDTATGAITGSLDTSAVTGDFTIQLNVLSLTGANSVIISLEDTAHATPFSEANKVAVWHVKGPFTRENPVKFIKHKYDLPGIRIGAANNALRFVVDKISGGTVETHGFLTT